MIKFYDKLSQDFSKLLESEYNYDTIIEVGEQPNIKLFKAHSVVLYQRSLYFQLKLTDTKKNNIINIKLPHISDKIFNIILKYIYGGTISLESIDASGILDLLIAFNEFNISESVEYLQSCLIDDNASWLRLNFSHVYQISFLNENFKTLQQFCNKIVEKHPNLIFDSDDFTTLQENALISLLKNDDLQLEESKIWDKVILWGKAQTPNLPSNYEQWTKENFKSLKTTLQNCLPHIRYFQISNDDVLEKVKPYKKILEKNLWDDIFTKCVSPNKPITSTILPPRKKLSIQLPPRKSPAITLSSSIITLDHAAEISSWIDRRSTIYDISEIPYEFKLLLRGSRDGFDGKIFHKLCDNIPNTIVVLKVKNSDEILGGYNPLTWTFVNSGYRYIETTDSFFFSLKNGNLKESILSRVINSSTAIYYDHQDRGPWFYHFGVNDHHSGPNKWQYYCQDNNYQLPIRSTQDNFSVDDYEVFQITRKSLSSSIITLEHAAEISSWIDRHPTIYDITKIPYEFKLLLRGSRDGFDGKIFHKLCDNIPNTIIVLKVKNSDEILGGYNPLSWKFVNEGDGYIETTDSFIFSLKNGNLKESILSRVINSLYAIYYSDQDPWFYHFGVNDHHSGPNKWQYYYQDNNYQLPIRNTQDNFSVDDYEVFQICNKV
ncbi:hypothetical protein C2G38_2188905 [Gigaspora rosea]|uniref:TLD-domain-containing protein n=1 Tax=Gigaspora rosea TaxID=44941 RepID=A0A397V474_9GLOM|nr:hypothetical protein C2G38_2188905 [Gigaspora rosea]